MLMRLFLLLALLVLAVPARAGRVVVMRGTYDQNARTNVYEYVGDESSLAAATLSGVNGDEVIEANRAKLRAEVDLYQAAQRASGVADPKPLYVLIDAKETWVYARWGSAFIVKKPDGSQERVTGGFIHLGEKVDYIQQNHTEELSRESNRALLTMVNQHYRSRFVKRDHRALVQQLFRDAPCVRSLPISDEPWEAYTRSLRATYAQVGCDLAKFDSVVAAFAKANPGTPETFEEAINKRFKFSLEGQTETSLSVYTEHLPHPRFVEELRALVTRDLADRGVADPGALFASQEAQDITRRFGRGALVNGVNAAVTHEIGHLVHFEAGQGLGFGPVRTGIPGAPSSHAATTLSNPGFALVEGWAEAAAFRFAEEPTSQDRRRATRIDYDDSLTNLQKFLNDRLLQAVGNELRAKNLMRDNTIPIEGGPMERTAPADFARALKAAAQKLGLPDADFDRAAAAVRADPSLATVRRRHAFTAHLQANAGQKKKRADFLSSEASVAYTIYQLDAALGGKFFERALPVIQDKHPEGLAPLLEAYIARYPEDRMRVYATLAHSTDGILLSQDQVQVAESNPNLHVDLDRDGKTPGPSANAAHPQAFPAESATFGPVPELEGWPLPLTTEDGTTTLAGSGSRASSAGLTVTPASDHRISWAPVSSPEPGTAPADSAGQTEVAVPQTGARLIPPAALPDDADLNRR